jgi:hypothetical protein
MGMDMESQDRKERVRRALIEFYEPLARDFSDAEHRCWAERLEALRAGEIVVEPGFLLQHVIDEPLDVFGLYRVYPDGRVERDRHIERSERDRFRRGGSARRNRARSDRGARPAR